MIGITRHLRWFITPFNSQVQDTLRSKGLLSLLRQGDAEEVG